MVDHFTIEQKFKKGERIVITSGFEQFLAFGLFIIAFLLSGSCFCIDKVLPDWIPIPIWLIMTVFLVIGVILFITSFRLADIGVKRELLLIKHFFTSCRILAKKDIQKVRVFHFLNLQIVYIRYQYKNRSRRTFFIKRKSPNNEKALLFKDLFLEK